MGNSLLKSQMSKDSRNQPRRDAEKADGWAVVDCAMKRWRKFGKISGFHVRVKIKRCRVAILRSQFSG
jgi:hypothetical protein